MKKNLKKKHSYRTELSSIINQASNSYSIVVKTISPKGKECRFNKKGDLCFCGHKLQQHVDEENGLSCSIPKCNCEQFIYLPSMSIKCHCKHSSIRHDHITHRCKQCTGCLGFTTDWSCNCGGKLLEHTTKRERVLHGNVCSSVVLPRLKKNKLLNYAKKDWIKQNLSLSQIKKFRGADSMMVERQSPEHAYLKEKLKEANLRYFAKFKHLQQSQEQEQNKTENKTALDLYIQPHFYRGCSLTSLLASHIAKSGK